ncbi:MAG TPA: sigma-70 family RNA polymerase sigma factor [Rhizomicrobium sp.]
MKPTTDFQRSAHGARDDAGFKTGICELIPQMRAFAHSLTHNREAADDLVQDTLVRAWQARESFEPGTYLRSWLFMILRNQFYSDRRRSWRQVAWDQESAEQIPDCRDEQSWKIELSDTARALAKLCDEQREALILIAAAGFSYEEAAAVCGCPVGTVKSRVARGRKALLALLESREKPDSQAPAEGGPVDFDIAAFVALGAAKPANAPHSLAAI